MHFLARLSSLCVRFICPIAILYFSDNEKMGQYYIFISFVSIAISISAFELAVPFAKSFLNSDCILNQHLAFTRFVTTLVLTSLVFSIPFALIASRWFKLNIFIFPLFCLFLTIEACSNEVGRFYWNIGNWKTPSNRDLIRAVISTIAFIISIIFEKKIISYTSLTIIIIGNLSILRKDCQTFGFIKMSCSEIFKKFKSARTSFLYFKTISDSLPQFIQMQVLAATTFFERILIENNLGLSSVAGFSFISSFIQSSSSLQLVKIISETRRSLLTSQGSSQAHFIKYNILSLFIKILIISAFCCLSIFLALPILTTFTKKNLLVNSGVIITSYISVVSAIFCSALAPFLTTSNVTWACNLFSFCGIIGIFISTKLINYNLTLNLSYFLICIFAIYQIILRFILSNKYKSS